MNKNQEDYKYKYRLKQQYSYSKKLNWVNCTEEEKQKVEKMMPNKYEFIPLEVPKPTENMIVEEKKSKTKQNLEK